jgi:hypothetical protein
MPHLILLGDSILDNAHYTGGGPDVVTQVRQMLPAGWRATLLAVDGSTTKEIPTQVKSLPDDASHLVLSVGGNDAIMNSQILQSPAKSTADALAALADVAQSFDEKYRRAVAACGRGASPLAVCTIYNGCFPDPLYQRLVSTALMAFNDVILRVAIERALPVIDLRYICCSSADYANPIEPSSVGGMKIARAIVNLMTSESLNSSGAHVVIG